MGDIGNAGDQEQEQKQEQEQRLSSRAALAHPPIQLINLSTSQLLNQPNKKAALAGCRCLGPGTKANLIIKPVIIHQSLRSNCPMNDAIAVDSKCSSD